ncbi:hypothetical protein [Sporolactobacillus pectinivorans]|uniref:hypothetical protein n=1 Tax=Sporolactobacillus pectinivorans TaxID=1591408 RepID=UPI000C259F4A|nr:hypothetical protein [Sporolactobacillus pectinivorans]
MNSPIVDEQEILLALEESGMESEMIEQFMESFRSGQTDKEKWILLSHRSKLLSDVHAKQDKLYCMDFLIRKLKSNKGLEL